MIRAPALFLLACLSPWAQAGAFAVAAAADLQHALPEIEAARVAKSGESARLVFGSSGTLFRQISQGAPFEIFMSADESLARRLIEQGRAEGPGRLYAVGRLALMVGASSALDPSDIKKALVDPRLRRLAMANPDHAPYGRAAQETLATLGLSEAFRGRVLVGENVAQAARFVLDGGADGGLVALAVALGAGSKARHAVVPADMHQPLRQRAVLFKGASQPARDFFAWLGSDEARRIFARHGFEAGDS